MLIYNIQYKIITTKLLQTWTSITPDVIELLRQMLHILPQKRPTAAQLLKNAWLWQTQPTVQQQPTEMSSIYSIKQASVALKGAVNATFRAILSPQAANIGPVGKSELAKRRAKDRPNIT